MNESSHGALFTGVRAKGTAFAAIVGYVRRHWGDAGLAHLAIHVRSFDAARILNATVLQGSWYPFAHFTSLLEAGDAVFPGATSFARRQAEYGAQVDLGGVYRAFVRLASPSFLVARAGKVWSQYYSSGELVVLESASKLAAFELRGFGSPHWAHCEAVAGWCERAAQMTGARDARASHPSCRARGERKCAFHIEWH